MSIKQVLSAAHQAEILNRDFRIEALTAERDQLRARVAELEQENARLSMLRHDVSESCDTPTLCARIGCVGDCAAAADENHGTP